MCVNQHRDHFKFLFRNDSFKLKKCLLKATPFLEYFDKKTYFVILHKLATFHYPTVFTSQVIQQNVFHVPSLGI